MKGTKCGKFTIGGNLEITNKIVREVLHGWLAEKFVWVFFFLYGGSI